MESYFRIVCALLNAFSPPLHPDRPEHLQLAQRKIERVGVRYMLQEQITERINLNAPTRWQNIDVGELQDFPFLVEEDLRELTFGVYQLRQAASYTAEHFTADGDYELQYYREQENLLRFRIHSRFSGSTVHQFCIH